MTLHYNRRSEKQKRKDLRNNATKAERILWKYLRNSQIENAKFLRQYSVDQYVIDFYCPEIKLAVEVDGSSHFLKEQIAYDIERENHIKSFGIQFIRFTNNEVYHKLESVLIQISNMIIKLRG